MRITGAIDYIEPRDSISHDWIDTLNAWGMTPLMVPNRINEPETYLDMLKPDLLVLSGGDDLGETPVRDETEYRLLDHAQKNGRPVLGVCRGMQLINNFFGGSSVRVEGHVATPHEVRFQGAWDNIYGSKTTTNSFHGQGINMEGLGAGLRSAASDGDGYIEALFHETQALAGIMWHPERAQAPRADRTLIETLVEKGPFWK